MFERRFPQRVHDRTILLSVVLTNLALVAWGLGWSALVGQETFLLDPGHDPCGRRSNRRLMLYIQHQYEDTHYRVPGEWRFELAALQGSLTCSCRGHSLGRSSATRITTTCTISARRFRPASATRTGPTSPAPRSSCSAAALGRSG